MTQNSANADAVRFFHEALAADQANDTQSAFQLNLASVSADPTMPGTWNNLGTILNKLRKYPAAAAAFHRSHLLCPESPLPIANYAWALQLSGRSEEALATVVDKLLPKDPDNAHHYTNLSQINLTLNHPDRALLAAETAIAKGDMRDEATLVLGLSQLRLGRYAEGLKNYEARMRVNPILKLLLSYPFPFWRGEDLTDKRLYIPCEQGLGDSVMALPFIIEAAKRAKQVIVHSHTPALKFYQRNLSAKNIKVFPSPAELPPTDYYCPTFSLPIALGLDDAGITNAMHKLKYAPVHFTGFERKDPKELRIGIAWAGDPAHDNDKWRSANLEAFLRLAEVPNARLFSLQVGNRKADIDVLGAHGTIKDCSPFVRDVNDTAAFIAQHLDVVVCVDTSVGHIAGAVGKRSYILMGKQSVDWRWQTGEGQAPWYPNTTMMRQKTAGDWASLIERVTWELKWRG